MKKHRRIIIIALLIITAIIAIPYITGLVAEQKFIRINEEVYPAMNIKPMNNTYQRGWFSSYSEATLEMIGDSEAAPKDQRFLLINEIDHGLLPFKSAIIRTTVQTPTVGISEKKKVVLLEMLTTVLSNGDTITKLKIPARDFQNGQTQVQWQTLQGSLYIKRHFNGVDIDIQGPQVQLDTDKGQFVMQNFKLVAKMQHDEMDKMQMFGNLAIAEMQLKGKDSSPVKVQEISFEGNNQNDSEHLTVAMKTGVQQVEVGEDAYGPSNFDFELRHWHTPTLSNIKDTLVEIHRQDLQPQMYANVAMVRLMPYGISLLKKSPEFAVNRLNVNTPDGELRGVLQVKLEPFDINLFALFSNPFLLLNAVNAQLDLLVAQSLLHKKSTDDDLPLKEVADTSAYQTIGQRLKIWLDRGILVPAKEQPDFYRSQMQFTGGVLQVNGRKLPIETIIY